MDNIFVIIPTYNESETITGVISDVLAQNKGYNIVIVDDCSTDDTAKKAMEFVRDNQSDKVVVLRHIINRGQGAALKTGTEYAIIKGADIIVHFDGDGQFLATEIAEVVEPLTADKADIVFGSRFLGKPSNMPGLKKELFLPLVRKLQSLFFGIKTTDPQSGFRAFSAATFKKLDWQQDRMAHCSEILHKAFQKKLRVQEAPTTVVYRHFGQKFSGGVKIIKELFIGLLSNS